MWFFGKWHIALMISLCLFGQVSLFDFEASSVFDFDEFYIFFQILWEYFHVFANEQILCWRWMTFRRCANNHGLMMCSRECFQMKSLCFYFWKNNGFSDFENLIQFLLKNMCMNMFTKTNNFLTPQKKKTKVKSMRNYLVRIKNKQNIKSKDYT